MSKRVVGASIKTKPMLAATSDTFRVERLGFMTSMCDGPIDKHVAVHLYWTHDLRSMLYVKIREGR